MSDETSCSASITGRCYCGALHIRTTAPAQVVAYCHCDDCRRVTGGPVAAFAAFAPDEIDVQPAWPDAVEINSGVKRWFCPACGSAIGAWFSYLPDQIYVPVGVIDQIDELAPELHCHADNAPGWLHLNDNLVRDTGTARDRLQAKSSSGSNAS